ncbi:MAG: tRNA 2-thiouridine(34) synthase MnmA, partial [Acetobacterium sp.]|nr:tRNA 2-thiouridine(34) synthase MnmA [Acetobacterium sp.]
GIGGEGSGEPWFVVKKDLNKNELVVVQGEGHAALYSKALEATEMNWIGGYPPAKEFKCTAKFRYRQSDQGVMVRVTQDRIYVEFDQPQKAVTPGQVVVLYQANICLGGGTIDAVEMI